MRHASTLAFFAISLFFLGVIAISVMPLGFVATVAAAVDANPGDQFGVRIAQILIILTLAGPALFLAAALAAALNSRQNDDQGG